MEKIGEKIKRIRKTNGWSQDAVLPEHQSLVSQIEKGGGKGGIMNPGRGTLEKIAKNMEMNLDELIKDTDWDPTKETSSTNEYAFSMTEATVKLEESGEIIIIMKSYPRYNDKGEENIYSPENGRRLVSTCEASKISEDGKSSEPCERSIESPTQRYCMSCGRSLVPLGMESWPKIKKEFWYSLDVNSEEIDRVSLWKDKELKRWGMAFNIADNTRDDDYSRELSDYFGQDGSRVVFEEGGSYAVPPILPEEFFQGYNSNNLSVVRLWREHDYRLSVLTGLLYELKRWTVKIVSGEVEPPPDKGNDEDREEDDLPF